VIHRTGSARRLRMNAETSGREVGRQCGLSQPTVAKIRAGPEAGAQIEQASERVGAVGRTGTPELSLEVVMRPAGSRAGCGWSWW
jgi:hypothetical protein